MLYKTYFIIQIGVITLTHVYLFVLFIPWQLQSYVPEYSEFSDDDIERESKLMLESSGNYYQKSTELSDTLEQTGERNFFNWEQAGEISFVFLISMIQSYTLNIFWKIVKILKILSIQLYKY